MYCSGICSCCCCNHQSIYLSIYLIYLSIYPSIYLSLSLCLSVCLSIYISFFLAIYLSLSLSLPLSIYLSIFLSIYLSTYIYLSIFLSFFLSFYLSILLFFYLSIDLSIYLFLSLCLSIYLSASLKTKLFCDTSAIFELDNIKNAAIQGVFLNFCTWQHQKRSNSARRPQFSKLTTSKAEQFCETSVKNGKLSAELMASYQCVLRFFHSTCLKYCACQVVRSAASVTQNHLSKPEDLRLQNATALRK